jgi:hypothetical protein
MRGRTGGISGIRERSCPGSGRQAAQSAAHCGEKLWPLVPETISSDLGNLLNGRQKALQPSQVQPVHQLRQGDLRCGEIRQDV